MKNFRNIFLLHIISLVFICCAPTIYKPTIEDVDLANKKWNNVSMDELQKGYSLYVAKCGSCHFLHRPTQFAEVRWLEILPIMAKKAKLNEEELDNITKYIISKSYAPNSHDKKK